MSDDELENYIAVNIQGVMLKKNFNYILLNEPDVKEFVGKESIKVDQKVHIEYKGTLQLAYFLIHQIYGDATFVDYQKEFKKIEAIRLQLDILIFKDENQERLVFEWKSSQKNDIIADCLAYMMSQIPDIQDFDIFHKSYSENQDRITSERGDRLQKINKLLEDSLPDFVRAYSEERSILTLTNDTDAVVIRIDLNGDDP
jgi:hypothetical protein